MGNVIDEITNRLMRLENDWRQIYSSESIWETEIATGLIEELKAVLANAEIETHRSRELCRDQYMKAKCDLTVLKEKLGGPIKVPFKSSILRENVKLESVNAWKPISDETESTCYPLAIEEMQGFMNELFHDVAHRQHVCTLLSEEMRDSLEMFLEDESLVYQGILSVEGWNDFQRVVLNNDSVHLETLECWDRSVLACQSIMSSLDDQIALSCNNLALLWFQLMPSDQDTLDDVLMNNDSDFALKLWSKMRMRLAVDLPPLEMKSLEMHRILIELIKTAQSVLLDRQSQYESLVRQLQSLWNALDIKDTDRLLEAPCLHKHALESMKQECARLVDVQREKFERAFDHSLIRLKELWQLLRTDSRQIESFLMTLSEFTMTSRGLEMLQTEINLLEYRWQISSNIFKLIDERHALIQKMIAFEATAKDPARLFRSSFQLVQEEKFRKTALPTLLRLEKRLFQTCQQFQADQNEPFIVDGNIYTDVIQREIDVRYVNETIFGFDPNHVPAVASNQQEALSNTDEPTGTVRRKSGGMVAAAPSSAPVTKQRPATAKR